MSQTRQDLDRAGCGTPFCGHDHTVLYLKPVCHMQSAVNVSYDKRTGELTLACVRCHAVVTKIAVAARPNVQ